MSYTCHAYWNLRPPWPEGISMKGSSFSRAPECLGPLRDPRCYRRGRNSSQSHSASSRSKLLNVAARKQILRSLLEIVTVFVLRGLEAWRNFAGPGLLLTARTARRNDASTSSDMSASKWLIGLLKMVGDTLHPKTDYEKTCTVGGDYV